MAHKLEKKPAHRRKKLKVKKKEEFIKVKNKL